MALPWRALIRERSTSPISEAVAVGAGLAVAYWALQLATPRVLGAFHDDAVYVALGKAIAEGHGYHSIYAVGEPVHLRFPPGLPAILALLWALGGTLPPVTWLAATLSILVTAASGGLVWWFARAKLGLNPWLALVLAIGPFLLDPAILYFSLPISEPYFLLAWAAALVLAARLRDRPSLGAAVGLGLVLSAAVLIRSQAVALLAGLLAALIVQRTSWRLVGAFLAASILPLALWTWWHAQMVAAGPISSQPDEASYLGWLSLGAPNRLPAFVGAALRLSWATYWDQIPGYLSGIRGLGAVLLAALLLFGVAGSVLLGRAQAPLSLMVVANAVAVFLWPWPQDRLVLAMFPFAGLLVAAGLKAILQKARQPVRVGAHALLGLLAGAIALRQVALRPFAYNLMDPRPTLGVLYPGYFLAANSRFVLYASTWLQRYATPGDRVLSDAPAGIYLYSGRHVVSASPARSDLQPSVFSRPGSYLASRILADSVTIVIATDARHPVMRDLATLDGRCPGVIRLAGEVQWGPGNWRAFVYRVPPPEGCLADAIQALGPATASVR